MLALLAHEPARGYGRRRRGTTFHVVLTVIVIVLSALVISSVSVPAAAVLSKAVNRLVDRFGGDVGRVEVPPIAERSVVVARGGEVLATLAGEENRVFVPLGRIPLITQQAVLAIEDAQFYQHKGVALTGLLRALMTNVKARSVRQGGSTITQQLVKNILVGDERSLDRKIREAKLAVALERTMGKKKILELYLNETYFGGGVYGIGTAAEYYFGRNVSKLTLPQSAMLAGLIKAPENLEPFRNPERARARRALVLRRMADERFITHEQAEAASERPLGAKRHPLRAPVEPYFVEYVKAQMLEDPAFAELGATRRDRARALFQAGLRIETTLDLRLQRAAKRAVAEVLDLKGDPSAALVSIEPTTGAVRAMVGGRDFSKSKYNLASQGLRQPGSTFKTFTMVAAIDAGISPELMLDTPSPIRVRYGGTVWPVRNYSGRGEGRMTMRRATELSVNSYYAQLITKVGPEKVAEVSKRMGIQTRLKPFLSLALGAQDVSPLELTGAYATLGAGGVHCRPFGIARVLDAAGNVIMDAKQSCRRAIDSSVAAHANSILQGVITRGTGRRNGQIGRPVAGKTGTTDDYADAWFAGYTPQFATVVWMGFKEGNDRPLYNIHGLPKVFGGSLPAMIWNRYMRVAHDGLPVAAFPAPPALPRAAVPEVVGMTVSEATKALAAARFSVLSETVTGWQPAGTVIAQTPAGGASAPKGSTVLLEVSDGAGKKPSTAQSPSPSPTPTRSPSPTPTATPTPSPSPSPSKGKKS